MITGSAFFPRKGIQLMPDGLTGRIGHVSPIFEYNDKLLICKYPQFTRKSRGLHTQNLRPISIIV